MRLGFLLVLLPIVSPHLAHADDYQVSIAPRGSAIELTFTNQTKTKIHIPTYVATDGRHYDWLAVQLEDGKGEKRAITFIADRDKAVPIYVDLEPGKSTSQTIDLQPWAVRTGAPIAPGDYTVVATWDTTREKSSRQRQTVTTKLTIAAPVDKRCKKAATGDLELLARQVGSTAVVEVGLHNTGSATLCVDSTIRAGQIQSDWLRITLDTGATKHELGFTAPRKGAVLRTVELPPGATGWTAWDLAAWASLGGNNVKLPHGGVSATIVYDASAVDDAWHGRIATTLNLTLP